MFGILVALISGIVLSPYSADPSKHNKIKSENRVVQSVPPKQLSKVQKHYLDTITNEYKVPKDMVREVLIHTDKYSHKVFPKREDILAVIGIESSWNPRAVSPLKKDPAVGLTQIRPNVWRKFINDASDLVDIENQIKYAAKILHYNYRLTKSPDDAIIAYNVGYGAWLEGNYGFDYLVKFKQEREKFRRS